MSRGFLGEDVAETQTAFARPHESRQRRDALVATRSGLSIELPFPLRRPNPSSLNGEMDWNRLHAQLEQEYKDRYETYKKMAEG